MTDRLPRHKALKLLDRAQLHLAHHEYDRAEALLREVLRSELKLSSVPGFLGDALAAQGRDDEALRLWREGLQKHPDDPELNARLGTFLSSRGRTQEALPHLLRAQAEKRGDWSTLLHLGHAFMGEGRTDEAERALIRAVTSGGGGEARVVLAMLRGRQGRYADAERLCLEAEAASRNPAVLQAARAMRGDARLLQGDAEGALSLWRPLQAEGTLDRGYLAHLAYAEQLSGDPAAADRLIDERTAQGAEAEDLLLFAQIANLRGQPDRALALLDASTTASGERHPGHPFEHDATRGRALRLLGRGDEAEQILRRLAEAPEAASARLGPKVHVDLGHLAAEAGDFENAARAFETALALDPDEPEAIRGLELTRRRIAWREELARSAEAKVEAARTEVEALRRRFSAREGELESLRSELERLRSMAERAEAQARSSERAAEDAQKQQVRDELLAREQEAEEKARASIEHALGEALSTCPPTIVDGFLVAERTWQKAQYTDLPPAAVAVLYCGAFERALFTLFVERFRRWLGERGRLADFLRGAVRERRGSRVEYFDHFVEAFDEERPGRAPSMGEVGRVLERRHEPYLRPFRDFLEEGWPLPDAFFGELAEFVAWSKQTLRDPVAHGRVDGVDYAQIRKFRERLLAPGGVLASLARVQTPASNC